MMRGNEARCHSTFWDVQERGEIFDPDEHFKEYHHFEKTNEWMAPRSR